jgi:hypothetical protein
MSPSSPLPRLALIMQGWKMLRHIACHFRTLISGKLKIREKCQNLVMTLFSDFNIPLLNPPNWLAK